MSIVVVLGVIAGVAMFAIVYWAAKRRGQPPLPFMVIAVLGTPILALVVLAFTEDRSRSASNNPSNRAPLEDRLMRSMGEVLRESRNRVRSAD